MLGLILASLLWGTTGTAAAAVPGGVSGLTIGAAAMGFGGLLLLLASPAGVRRVLRDRAVLRWVLTGAVAVVVYPLAFYSGMAAAGVVVGNTVALGSAPIFAALLEWMLERRRPSARWVGATLLAVAGLVLLAAGGGEGDRVGTPHGILLGLLAGVAYAVYTYASRRVLEQGHPSREVMGAVFGVGCIPLLAVLLVTGGPVLAEPTSIPLLAYLAVGPMFVGYLLFGAGLRRVSSSTATTVTLLEPVAATALAVLVVGERLPVLGWIGVAALLLGVLALVVPRRPTPGVAPG